MRDSNQWSIYNPQDDYDGAPTHCRVLHFGKILRNSGRVYFWKELGNFATLFPRSSIVFCIDCKTYLTIEQYFPNNCV